MRLARTFGFVALLPLVVLAAAGSVSALTPTLKVGDLAPPLKVMTWIKGTPVTRFERGQVYVVDFWATWCGNCIAVMPHLSELQKQYAGHLTVIGVSVLETENATGDVASVKAFVAKMGDKMAFPVAMDDQVKKTVFDAWMTAAGSGGIPTAFVIGQDGRLAWIGFPTDDAVKFKFDQAVTLALAGKADLGAASQLQADVNVQAVESAKKKAILQGLHDAQRKRDYKRIIVEADQLMAQHAAEYDCASRAFIAKLDALLHLDENEALSYARSEEKNRKVIGTPEAPNYWLEVAEAIAEVDGLSRGINSFALNYLEEGATRLPEAPPIWISLATVRHRLGKPEEAIAAQEAAIAAARKRGFTEDDLEPLQEKLEEYKRVRT